MFINNFSFNLVRIMYFFKVSPDILCNFAWNILQLIEIFIEFIELVTLMGNGFLLGPEVIYEVRAAGGR